MPQASAKALLFIGLCGLPTTAARARELVMPPAGRSLETLERAITAVHVDEGRLVLMPYRKAFGVVTPLAPPARLAAADATREASFGRLTDSRRLEVVDPKAPSLDWRGIDVAAGKLLLATAEELLLVEADPATLREVTRRTVARDLIRPAADPRGEPTTAQTAALRKRFTGAWRETSGVRLAGLARVPEAWKLGGDKRRYLAALRVRGFPLVMLECELDEPSSCRVARQCNLEGAKGLASESIAGIAASAERREVVIGDTRERKLHVFAFESCYHVPKRATLGLPKQLRDPVNLHVDALDRLWVATKGPDDYLNASVYVWGKEAW